MSWINTCIKHTLHMCNYRGLHGLSVHQLLNLAGGHSCFLSCITMDVQLSDLLTFTLSSNTLMIAVYHYYSHICYSTNIFSNNTNTHT